MTDAEIDAIERRLYASHQQWSPPGSALVYEESPPIDPSYDWDKATAEALECVDPVGIETGVTNAFNTHRTRIVLPTFHIDQARAFWKFKQAQSRRYLLRCGRRYGKTDFGKTWLLDGFARGWPCAWYAPQHKTWSEAYSEMVDNIAPVLGPGSSKGGAVMRGTTGGRVDFWTLENPIAGRGRHYRRVVIDEAAFGKDGDEKTDGSLMATFQKVILPTLFDYGGEILVMSNSAGKKPDNFLYQISPEGADGEGKLGFVEHHAETKDNPLLPKRMPGETPQEWLARRTFELEQLVKQSDPLVYDQENRALFVDWSGKAFFQPEKWMVGQTETNPLGHPLQGLRNCHYIFATVDTALKTGQEHDGTAVCYWAVDPFRKPGEGKLILLDWDIVQIDGAFLDTWLKTVYQRLDDLKAVANPMHPLGSIGVFIEDKGSGITLLQDAKNKGWLAHPVDSGFTAMGKDERAVSVSTYHFRGDVKILQAAWDKKVTYKRQERNHFVEQVTGYRIADPDAAKRADDLADAYMSGISVAVGNSEGF